MSAKPIEANLSDRLSPEAMRHLMAFKQEVHSGLPGKVERMILFGSRARGDAEEDSDYDVAVFVRKTADNAQVDAVLSEAAFQHILEGVYISPIALPDDYLTRTDYTALAEDISREGIDLP